MTLCPRCGTAFECGMEDATNAGTPCWCTQLPPLPAEAYLPNRTDAGAGRCFCPYCLRALLAAGEASPQKGRRSR